MGKQTTTGNQASSIVWDNLEEWVRRKVQEFIQSLLEEEIAELLGRQKSERRKAVDSSTGLPERLRQRAEADVGLWDHHTAPAQGEGTGGTF